MNRIFEKIVSKALTFVTCAALISANLLTGMNGIKAVAAANGNWADNNYTYAATAFAGGSGTSENPYKIATGAQLAYLAEILNQSDAYCSKTGQHYAYSCYSVTEDIDLSAHYWTSIGVNAAFCGTFDGNGHTISGMTFSSDTDDYRVGLFANTGGIIKNVVLKSPVVYSNCLNGFTGALAGVGNGYIDNCRVTGTDSIVKMVSTYGTVGGLVGIFYGGVISNSSFSGTACGSGEYIGGLAGSLDSSLCVVSNSYAVATVTSFSSTTYTCIGGIAGNLNGSCYNCYAAAKVIGGKSGNAGAFAGHNVAKLINAYYDSSLNSNTSGVGNSGTEYPATGLTASVMEGADPSAEITFDIDASGTTDTVNGMDAFIDALDGGSLAFRGTATYKWSPDSESDPSNGGYPILSSTILNNPGIPAVSVDSNTFASGYGIEATSTKDGMIYLVNETTDHYTTKSALENAAISYVSAEANTQETLSTDRLNAGYYEIYAVDEYGNVSKPVEITLTGTISAGDWSDIRIDDASFAGGSGTKGDPYQIATNSQIAYLAQFVCNKTKDTNNSNVYYSSEYYELTSDIDLSGRYWMPIGETNTFSGVFDGNGHSISGITFYTKDSGHWAGLFGEVSGSLENITLDSPIIYNSYDEGLTGALAGYVSGYISNCHVIGSSSLVQGNGAESTVGGLAGDIDGGEISNSSFYGTVESTDSSGLYTGGIAGTVSDGRIENSYACATITNEGKTASPETGGLVGNVKGSKIYNCYSAGSVTGYTSSDTGSFIGNAVSAKIINCYYDSDTNSTLSGIGSNSTSYNATGFTTSVMKGKDPSATITANTDIDDLTVMATSTGKTAFVNALNNGRAIVSDLDPDTWKADSDSSGNGGYPVLASLTDLTDTTAPTVSVDSKSITVGGDIEATSTEGGTIYLVVEPTDNYTSASELKNAAVQNVSAEANKHESISTSGLSAGGYQVYAADTSGNVSEPIGITLVKASDSSSSNKGDRTIDGSQDTSPTGSTDSISAKITSSDTDTTAISNIIVNLQDVTVAVPSSVLKNALGTGSGNYLKISQGSSSSEIQDEVSSEALKIGVTPISDSNICLTRYYSSGSSEAVQQLDGSATVVIKFTDSQAEEIGNASSAQVYSFDAQAGSLTKMDATFDTNSKDVTFNTDYFGTYIIALDSTAGDSTIGVTYKSHVQGKGWMNFVSDGTQSGTTGQSLRMEAVKIELTGDVPTGASIIYQANIQKYGWLSPVSDGMTAGTTGKRLRLEAIRITINGLTGYSVQYRVHIQHIGWQSWKTTENGTDISNAATAGTTGKSLHIEAIEIRIVKTN